MSKNKAAASLGKKGGKVKSLAKAQAARINGAKGGRPSRVESALRRLIERHEEEVNGGAPITGEEWEIASYALSPDSLNDLADDNARLRALVEPAAWAVKLIQEHWADEGRDACNLDGWCALKDALSALPSAMMGKPHQ